MNRDEWHRQFLDTLRGLDAVLARRVEAAGEDFGAPVSGAPNESPADSAVIFWALISHTRADQDFGEWAARGSGTKLPRGHLRKIMKIAGNKTLHGEKQFSNTARFYVGWSRKLLNR